MKVKPSFLVSVNTCTVTLCDTSNWWSDVSGNLSDSIKSNELKLKRNNLGFHVNIFKWYNCQTLKWLQICGEKAAYGEVLLWMNFSKKKAQCTVHGGPNRNLTHFRGFHHKSRSSSNNHFLCSVFSYSEVLFFFDSVVALHLYRYCLDPKEKSKKKIKNLFFVLFSCLIIGRTLFMFHQ